MNAGGLTSSSWSENHYTMSYSLCFVQLKWKKSDIIINTDTEFCTYIILKANYLVLLKIVGVLGSVSKPMVYDKSTLIFQLPAQFFLLILDKTFSLSFDWGINRPPVIWIVVHPRLKMKVGMKDSCWNFSWFCVQKLLVKHVLVLEKLEIHKYSTTSLIETEKWKFKEYKVSKINSRGNSLCFTLN